MKKRLVIFHPALAPYRLDLFNSLNRLFDLHLVFTNRNVPYQQYDQASLLAQLDADYSYLDSGFRLMGRQVSFGAAKTIARLKPDVVVTSEFSLLTLQIAIGSFPGNPRHVVWTADNPQIVDAEKKSRSLMRHLILPRIDGLIVYSEAVKNYYQQRFTKLPRIGISPNAQSETVFRQRLEDSLGHTRQLIGVHRLERSKVLLYVGRLAKEKGLDRLLAAFAATVGANDAVILVLVGEGPAHDALVRQAADSGISNKTIFAGHCEGPELYAWFNLGAVFALPSSYEPWGAVVNEALIAGLPVVCSKDVGARELITDGVNGSVVDAGDIATFAEALAQWLENAPKIDSEPAPEIRQMLLTVPFSDAVAGFSEVVRG